MAFQPTALRNVSVTATANMTLVTDTADLAVEAELTYHTRDPYAVHVVFSVASSQAVEWVFSRELLIGGIRIPAGTGDVQIFPTHDGVVFELNSPAGRARLLADPEPLSAFAEEMLAAVPLGSELKYFHVGLNRVRLRYFAARSASVSR